MTPSKKFYAPFVAATSASIPSMCRRNKTLLTNPYGDVQIWTIHLYACGAFLRPPIVDLMTLDSNCQKELRGNAHPHYAPWPTSGSDGVNVFANPLPAGHSINAFLPFVLLGQLLRYIFDQDFHGAFTSLVPDL